MTKCEYERKFINPNCPYPNRWNKKDAEKRWGKASWSNEWQCRPIYDPYIIKECDVDSRLNSVFVFDKAAEMIKFAKSLKYPVREITDICGKCGKWFNYLGREFGERRRCNKCRRAKAIEYFFICECKKPFRAAPSLKSNKYGVYCSKECRMNHNEKMGKKVHSGSIKIKEEEVENAWKEYYSLTQMGAIKTESDVIKDIVSINTSKRSEL